MQLYPFGISDSVAPEVLSSEGIYGASLKATTMRRYCRMARQFELSSIALACCRS